MEEPNDKDYEQAFKGSYLYIDKGRVYSEESFIVSENIHDHGLFFKSEILSRVPNGEFLKIDCSYYTTHDFFPFRVEIKRNLGKKESQETFLAYKNKHVMDYSFIGQKESKETTFNIPSRFQVSTPSMCCSFLYIPTKKYDPTILNRYSMICSNNIWEFKGNIQQNSIYVGTEDKNHNNTVEVQVQNQTLTANKYVLFDQLDQDSDDEHDQEKEKIFFYLSEHFFIPYLISFYKDIEVQIKYLTNLRASKEKISM